MNEMHFTGTDRDLQALAGPPEPKPAGGPRFITIEFTGSETAMHSAIERAARDTDATIRSVTTGRPTTTSAQAAADINAATLVAIPLLSPDDAVPGRPVAEYMRCLADDRAKAQKIAIGAAECLEVVTFLEHAIDSRPMTIDGVRRAIKFARKRALDRFERKETPQPLRSPPGRRPWPGVPS